jgi:hypothetical protein
MKSPEDESMREVDEKDGHVLKGYEIIPHSCYQLFQPPCCSKWYWRESLIGTFFGSFQHFLAFSGGKKVLEWAYPVATVLVDKQLKRRSASRVRSWKITDGAVWTMDMKVVAALHGQLEVVQYAFERGLPWDEQTCS